MREAVIHFGLAGVLMLVAGCNSSGTSGAGDNAGTAKAAPSIPAAEQAPAPDTTGGFDGQKAYDHVRRQVEMGPRPPGSDAHRRVQQYIISTLKGYGCAVQEHAFTARTPNGPLGMKNIIATIPGQSDDILLLLTHYDTATWIPDFVGANDSGSSTGVMLEMARLLCTQKRPLSIWIAFLDGEEAIIEWTDKDSLYGSRELAAKLSLEGVLPRVKAALLADMVGYRDLRFKRDTNSTGWLVELMWGVAARLGYESVFVRETTAVDDDHMPFIRRGVAAVDVIQFDVDYPHWHTPQDTLDKISPRSLAITGHVFLESITELEKKFR